MNLHHHARTTCGTFPHKCRTFDIMPSPSPQLCHEDGGNFRSLACAKWDTIIKVSWGLFCTRDQEPWKKKQKNKWFRVSRGHGWWSNAMPLKVFKCVMSTVLAYGALHAPTEIRAWRVVLHTWPRAVGKIKWFGVSRGHGRRFNAMPLKVSKCIMWMVLTYRALHVPSEIWSWRFHEGCFAHVTKGCERKLI